MNSANIILEKHSVVHPVTAHHSGISFLPEVSCLRETQLQKIVQYAREHRAVMPVLTGDHSVTYGTNDDLE